MYSFWDAVTACLYEEAIYSTGITAVLVDDSDDRISFKSDSDRDAFLSIHSELSSLSRDALAIRSADRADTTHSHDKTASVRRAARVIETWNAHIQPILDTDKRPTPSQDSSGNGHAEQTEINSSSDLGDSAESGQKADNSTRNEEGESNGQDGSGNADSTGEEVSPLSTLPDDFDPDNISLDRESTADPNQSIFEKPQLTPALNPVMRPLKTPATSKTLREIPSHLREIATVANCQRTMMPPLGMRVQTTLTLTRETRTTVWANTTLPKTSGTKPLLNHRVGRRQSRRRPTENGAVSRTTRRPHRVVLLKSWEGQTKLLTGVVSRSIPPLRVHQESSPLRRNLLLLSLKPRLVMECLLGTTQRVNWTTG